MFLFRFMTTVRILNHLTVLKCSGSTSRQQRETWIGSLEDLDGPTKRSRGFAFITVFLRPRISSSAVLALCSVHASLQFDLEVGSLLLLLDKLLLQLLPCISLLP